MQLSDRLLQTFTTSSNKIFQSFSVFKAASFTRNLSLPSHQSSQPLPSVAMSLSLTAGPTLRFKRACRLVVVPLNGTRTTMLRILSAFCTLLRGNIEGRVERSVEGSLLPRVFSRTMAPCSTSRKSCVFVQRRKSTDASRSNSRSATSSA